MFYSGAKCNYLFTLFISHLAERRICQSWQIETGNTSRGEYFPAKWKDYGSMSQLAIPAAAPYSPVAAPIPQALGHQTKALQNFRPLRSYSFLFLA